MQEQDNNISNYIPINRNIFKHAFWLEKREYSKAEAWIDLLQTARFETSEGKTLVGSSIIKFGRGEIVASVRFLVQRWQWSIGKVTRFLDLLEAEKMIIRRQDSGNTVIAICNYNVYNCSQTQRGTGLQKNGKKTEHQTRRKTEHQAEHPNPIPVSVSEEERNTSDTPNGTPIDTRAEHERYETNKVNKEIKNTEAPASLKKYRIDLPFSSEAFLAKWKSWIEYKAKQYSFTYKTIDSEKEALNELVDLSDNTESIAIAIINKSMVKGWKGLFKLKEEELPTKHQAPANGRTLTIQSLNYGKR